MSQEVHGGLENQEGPEKGYQVGLGREIDIINYCTGSLFIYKLYIYKLWFGTVTDSTRQTDLFITQLYEPAIVIKS